MGRLSHLPLEERFIARVEVDLETGCWIWTGATWGHGYAKIKAHGRRVPAHRVAYELYIGPIPEGLEMDHLCRVKHCVNPFHVEPVTHAENVRRGNSGQYLSKRTHCKNGHPFDAERPDGTGRRCSQCGREASLRYYHRQKNVRIK